ncbi:MAG TPA: DNA replication and repair protein RecF [Candidatus Saccharimonadales bacterium]|nr:DNA replication and repair protein RecF [Candidatus Saccharimonadales bacterium]
MISNLRLQHFRSYKDSTFEFGPGVNIIVGPNASGKTNLLEAVLVLCRGSSYRAPDRELVTHNRSWARLDGLVSEQARSVKLQVVEDAINKEYIIGGTVLKRLPLLRSVPAVVFEPNHLQLLTESPELRRGFLDDLLEQTIPTFGGLRRAYKRTLMQRNTLLKQDFSPDQLFIWNVRLSELGGQVAELRMAFIDENRAQLVKLYNKLAGKRLKTDMVYQSKLPLQAYGSAMLKTLEARTDIDRERGFTTIGPHRDDLQLLLGGYQLSANASRGETRTMLLALKLLEVKSLEKARGTKPILLLDDVFSELDGARRQALTIHLQDHQTFITTTDADIVVQHFLDNCTVIPTTG